jgi:hypothetical protein
MMFYPAAFELTAPGWPTVSDTQRRTDTLVVRPHPSGRTTHRKGRK